jgi:hypothetical protein
MVNSSPSGCRTRTKQNKSHLLLGFFSSVRRWKPSLSPVADSFIVLHLPVLAPFADTRNLLPLCRMLRLQNNGKLGYFLMSVMADYRGFAQEMRAVIDQTRPKWEPLKENADAA